MKRILYPLLFSLLLFSAALKGQAPAQFNYQAVARTAAGTPIVNQSVAVRLKIHTGIANDAVQYSETRSVSTNAFGLFAIAIGSAGATNVTGSLAAVSWDSSDKFLQVEIDPAGGNNFINMGTTQLLAVPYALHASKANKLILPFSETITNTQAGFEIVNNGTGASIAGAKGASGLSGPYPTAVLGNVSNTRIGVTGLSEGGYGVYGESLSEAGVFGLAHDALAAGVVGKTNHIDGWGVNGEAFGGGIGGLFTSPTGTALKTYGKIEMNQTGEPAGKILMTDVNGNTHWEGAIGFSARDIGATGLTVPSSAETIVPFHEEAYDAGNNFILSGSFVNPNTFVAPVKGIYHFDASVIWNTFATTNGYIAITLWVNNNAYLTTQQNASTDRNTSQLSVDVKLNALDRVYLTVYQNSGVTQTLSNLFHGNRFSGHFLFRQ